jgi:O-antigen/teichoic acid export membrane protein
LEYFESKIAFITLGIVSYVIVDSHFRANSNYYFLALISIMSFVFYVLTFNKSSPEDAFLSYFILWFLLMLTLSLNFKVNTLSRVKEMLISSLPIFLSTFLFVLTFKIDLYFLKKLNLDEYIFGFEILDKISILIWSIVGLMCQVMFVNKVEKNESIHSIITNRREFYTIFFALIFVFISFFILLNYADAWNIPILLSLFFSIFTIIRVFNIVIIQLFYYAQNAESLVLKLYTVAAMINISLNIPLSYFFEATGLMISTVIASIFVLYNLIINEKNV